jgi:phosphate transport system substrate-binding protein
MRCTLGLLFLTFAIGCGGGNTGGGVDLQGAGSSFVDPMMQEWTKPFKEAKKIDVNYQSKGSAAGITMMTETKVDFGCTDAPLNKDQLKKAEETNGDVIHVPLCMGAVAMAYNLEGNPEVRLTGELLAKIYLGDIKKWNDDALQKIQAEGVKLPNLDIVVVARADGSGTSHIFSDYMQKVCKEKGLTWKPGQGLKPEFGKHVKEQNKSDGVTGFIKNSRGAIGYVEVRYAMNAELPYAIMQNSKGKWIKADDVKGVTAAAASTPEKEITDDLCFSMTDAPGEDAYPISGTVWAVMYVKQSPEKAKALKDFLTWVTHDGQKYCEKLHYAPLPENLVKKIDAKLDTMKVGGK